MGLIPDVRGLISVPNQDVANLATLFLGIDAALEDEGLAGLGELLDNNEDVLPG